MKEQTCSRLLSASTVEFFFNHSETCVLILPRTVCDSLFNLLSSNWFQVKRSFFSGKKKTFRFCFSKHEKQLRVCKLFRTGTRTVCEHPLKYSSPRRCEYGEFGGCDGAKCYFFGYLELSDTKKDLKNAFFSEFWV